MFNDLLGVEDDWSAVNGNNSEGHFEFEMLISCSNP
jgi:hypothetical protein